MATRMIQRRGTSAEWTAANPILAAGEIGFETDTTKFKFGDGTTAWAAIPYFASADQLIDGAPELLDTLNELAAAIGDDEDFITTITSGLNSKLSLTGGSMSGNLVMSSGAISLVSGDVILAQDPTNPSHAATKNYVDNSHVDSNIAITTLNSQVSSIESGIANFKHVFVSDTTPTVDGNDSGEILQEGDVWYDRSNGHVYIYINTVNAVFAWVEQGGSADYADDSYGINNNDFPATPTNGDVHKGYVYDSSRTAWNIIEKTTTVSDNTDVAVDTPLDDQVLMYNSATGFFENVNGVRLDEVGQIPLTFLNTVKDAIEGGAVDQGYQTLLEVQNSVATEFTNLLDGATAPFDTLGKIQTYVNASLALSEDVSKLTVMSATEWASDVSIPESGSLNVETGGAEVRVKIGNGADAYAALDYIPSNADITSEIATAIAPLAPKAGPTFTGTVSLPSTTSIGDVDATEISYLNGVTSAVQTQIDDLDTAKADLASPTFTGTVSGIDKTMVGLENVDNTTDANKPVSTATQTALDLKANIASPSFSGTAEAADLIITGNLTVQGTTTTISASDLVVRDNMIYLNQAGLFDLSNAVGDGTNVVFTTTENHDIKLGDYVTVTGVTPVAFDVNGDGVEVTAVTSNTITILSSVTDTYVSGGTIRGKSHFNPDLGWSAGRYDVVNGTGYGHAGLFRDATDGVFKFYDGYTPEPDESVFIDTTHASFELAPIAPGKVVFPDGSEQTKAGVPSISTFTEKTASYTLDTLDHQDGIVEMNSATEVTFTIPTNLSLAWPVGASIDVFASGTGTVTIAGDTGVTVNATPGLVLRTQWSSATLLKRGVDSWVVYGDLKA